MVNLLHVGLVSGIRSLETRDRNASKHAIDGGRTVAAGRRGQHKQYTVEASEIESGCWIGREPGYRGGRGRSLSERRAQAVVGRVGRRVNAGSKQNDRQHKRSGQQQLERG